MGGMDIADESVTSADMRAEFRQRFDVGDVCDVGEQFEHEQEFAGFGGLGHEVDAVEIVCEDSTDSEIAKIVVAEEITRG